MQGIRLSAACSCYVALLPRYPFADYIETFPHLFLATSPVGLFQFVDPHRFVAVAFCGFPLIVRKRSSRMTLMAPNTEMYGNGSQSTVSTVRAQLFLLRIYTQLECIPPETIFSRYGLFINIDDTTQTFLANGQFCKTTFVTFLPVMDMVLCNSNCHKLLKPLSRAD